MHKETFFSTRRIILLILIGITLMGLAAASYWYFLRVRPVTTLMTKAEQHLQDQEWGAAVRALKRVLQLKPRHLEANILVGDILFQFRHPATQHFYLIAYETAPERWDIWKRLVDYHILMSDRYQAKQMIDDPPSDPAEKEIWWEAYFNFSLKSGDLAEARRAAQKLIIISAEKRLSWDFVLAQINAQDAPEAELRAAGQQRLLEFYQESPRWRHSAARIYAESVWGDGDTQKSLAFIRQWLSLGDVPFDDALFLLNLAGESDGEIFRMAMERLQAEADSGARVSQLMQWFLGRGKEKEMWAWLLKLDEELLETTEVLSIFSIYSARQEDWITLENHLLLSPEKWQGDLSLFYLYSAYVQSQKRDIINVQMLRQAAREAGQERGGFQKLKQGCMRLNWRRGWRELLPFLMYEPSAGFPAAMELYREAVEQKRYEELLKIAIRAYGAQPEDYAASNNYAYLSLVYGNDLEVVHEIAAKNYREHPERVYSVVTYLLSLWRQQNDDEAFRVLSTVNPEWEANPSIRYARSLVLATRMPQEAAQVREKLSPEMFSPMEWKLLTLDPSLRTAEVKQETPLDSTESLKSYVEQSGFKQGWASRTLIKSLLQDGKESDAYDLISQWLDEGKLNFEDAFFALTTIRANEREGLAERLLQACQQQSVLADDVARLMQWMMKHEQVAEALAWRDTVATELRDSPEVLNVMADEYIQNRDWQSLQEVVLKDPLIWKENLRDYYLIQALYLTRSGGLDPEHSNEIQELLRKAVNTIGKDLAATRQVKQRLLDWGWESGWTRFNTIYITVDQAERQRLERSRERGESRPVLSTELAEAREFLKENPASPEAKARVAYYGILASGGNAELYAMAEEVYHADPTGVTPVAVRLLALNRQGKNEEAMKVIEAIPTRWKYHPTLLLMKVLVFQNTLPDEVGAIRQGLEADAFTIEEWKLLSNS